MLDRVIALRDESRTVVYFYASLVNMHHELEYQLADLAYHIENQAANVCRNEAMLTANSPNDTQADRLAMKAQQTKYRLSISPLHKSYVIMRANISFLERVIHGIETAYGSERILPLSVAKVVEDHVRKNGHSQTSLATSPLLSAISISFDVNHDQDISYQLTEIIANEIPRLSTDTQKSFVGIERVEQKLISSS